MIPSVLTELPNAAQGPLSETATVTEGEAVTFEAVLAAEDAAVETGDTPAPPTIDLEMAEVATSAEQDVLSVDQEIDALPTSAQAADPLPSKQRALGDMGEVAFGAPATIAETESVAVPKETPAVQDSARDSDVVRARDAATTALPPSDSALTKAADTVPAARADGTITQALVESAMPRDVPQASSVIANPSKAEAAPAIMINQPPAKATVAATPELVQQQATQIISAPLVEEVADDKTAPRLRLDPAAPVAPATPATPTAPPPAVALAQVLQAASAQAEGKETRVGSADIEVATPSLTTDRPSTTTVTATGAGPTAGAETARHAANQIAVAIGNQPGKVTEIQLSPDELGRVKLSLVAGDGVITLNLMAERAETQDLLRRHLDVLAQEFRNIGYSDINFSFGAEGQAQTGDGDADEPAGSVTVAPDETDATPSNAQLYITTGLDLRL